MISVILMAYGSPSRMEDVLPYLEGIYEGKPVPEYALKENTEKYEMSNGVSPSNAIIERIVRKLGIELSAHGKFNVILGNKHWTPTLSDAIDVAEASGSDRIIGIPLFPFESTNVRDSYLEPTLAALGERRSYIEVKFVNGFSPRELASMWSGILKRISIEGETAIMFDSHSLPLFRGPEHEYNSAFRETAKLIAEETGLEKYFCAYQSQGKYGNKWLGPSVYETLEVIGSEGFSKIIAAPIGFIYEHLEILYDLDHEFGEKVRETGLDYARSDLPNDSSAFISILKDHILKETGEIIEQH